MEFRFDFTFRIFMDLLYYGFDVLFFKVLFLHSATIGGWREDQAMVFVASFLVIDGMAMTLLSTNMWYLPQIVNKGDLDYYLLRPVSSLFFLSFREVSINSLVNMLSGAGLFVWALGRYQGAFTAIDVMLYVALILCGFLIYYLTRMLFIIPVFWTHSSRGFEQVFWGLSKFMERPDKIYTGWARRVLLTVLPFALIASTPSRVFFGGSDPKLIAHCIGVALILFVAVRMLWQRGLRVYSSASS